jgi:hypothetical protein
MLEVTSSIGVSSKSGKGTIEIMDYTLLIELVSNSSWGVDEGKLAGCLLS